jgi:hypothetical protein
MLARMFEWQEPEHVKHDHVHLQVDSAFIEQLRAGYGELGGLKHALLPGVDTPAA